MLNSLSEDHESASQRSVSIQVNVPKYRMVFYVVALVFFNFAIFFNIKSSRSCIWPYRLSTLYMRPLTRYLHRSCLTRMRSWALHSNMALCQKLPWRMEKLFFFVSISKKKKKNTSNIFYQPPQQPKASISITNSRFGIYTNQSILQPKFARSKDRKDSILDVRCRDFGNFVGTLGWKIFMFYRFYTHKNHLQRF